MRAQITAIILCVSACISNVFCNRSPSFTYPVSPVIIAREDTPIGTILTNITAMDADGPKELVFSMLSNTANIVTLSEPRGSSITGRSVDVILNSQLDRDFNPSSSLKLQFNVEDNSGGIGNTITQELTLYITDVNDEAPEFQKGRYTVDVREDASINTDIIKITARDPDTGDNGEFDFSMELSSGSGSVSDVFVINPKSGQVRLNQELDANENNYYEYVLLAKDKGSPSLTGTSILSIRIKDVQNTPPYFTNLPYSKQILENATINSQVLQVTALDGDRDRDIRNNLTFSIVSGDTYLFDLNAETGWITVKGTLDRDTPDVRQRGGVYVLHVKATELDDSQDISKRTATTLVTITALDVNDNAPKFNSDVYQATIQENMQEGAPITFTGPGKVSFMNASDIDQGKNSHFSLSLEKDGKPFTDFFPSPNEIFSESSILIRVQNRSALDSERVSFISFVIVARETDTVEIRSSSATVTVSILDINDNPPVFEQNPYPQANVSENDPIGTEILQVKATDLDKEENRQITYHIRGSNPEFKINETSGVITLAKDLDRETVDSYDLTVEARDKGGLSDTTNLDIVVGDVNDNPPLFQREEYFGTLPEDSKTFLRGDLIVKAVDDDKADTPNSEVRYGIIRASAGLTDKFAINDTTGQVTLVDTIDYESLPASLNGRVILEVKAYDLGSPVQNSSVNVIVEIQDVNDVSPVFNQTDYTAAILESAKPGTIVDQVFATDGDSAAPNNRFLYRIDTGAFDKFRINFDSGEITIEQGAILNREEKSTYILNVSATDRGAKSLTGYCRVTVTIDDVNDEPPVFVPLADPVSVRENAAIDFQVVCLTATDPDLNPVLSYSIVPNSVKGKDENSNNIDVTATGVNDYFRIDKTSGCIFVKSTLNRELVETVQLQINVTDENSENGAVQTAITLLEITIDDFNDNPPEFQPNNTYSIRVSEGREPGSEILRLETRDKDKDQGVSFEMGTNLNNSFTVSETTGILSLNKALDREQNPNLGITVIATDHGSPAYSSTATIFIAVSDTNDNTPMFVGYRTSYYVTQAAANNNSMASYTAMDLDEFAPVFQYSWIEDEPTGSPVIQIIATDKDVGRNADISYSILQEGDYEFFEMDTVTGILRNRRVLDRETHPNYEIKIKAEDKGEPVLYNILTLVINLLDKDDNPPLFPRGAAYTPFRAQIEEERTYNESTASVAIAVDPDIGANNKTCYYIIGGDPSNVFHLEAETGHLMLQNRLDRERLEHPFIDLVILTNPYCPPGMPKDTQPLQVPPTDYFSNTSILWVRVEILDINDNPPEFKQSVLTLGVTRETVYATSLGNLKDFVTDKDETLNCTFRAVKTEQYVQNKAVTEPFKVFPNGSVFTNTFFRSDMYGYFLIYIQAIEDSSIGPPFVVNATLRISLINDDQRIKVVFKNTSENVRKFQVVFAQKLQNTTGYRIVVDRIQTHENKLGQPDVEKTDMFIHGEDLKTNETISSAELLRVIDAAAEALFDLRYQYKVLEIVPVVAATEEEDLENVFKMALILVAISLGLLCCAIAIVFYISREQYKRKLKAATAMAYGSSSDLQKLEMPGTNLHSYENVNPIYLEKVKLEEVGEARDDDDSLDDNAVETVRPDPYSEQHKSMNFYTENGFHNPDDSKNSAGTDILDAALRHHEENKTENIPVQNGHRLDSYQDLPTTQI